MLVAAECGMWTVDIFGLLTKVCFKWRGENTFVSHQIFYRTSEEIFGY